MLPKIKIVSAADGDMSFKLIRLQYPVRLAFSMTMNKSQGQSLKYVGVNVQEEVFSHGQLYVALLLNSVGFGRSGGDKGP
jgi:ATP-dependent exoDNAse (exonuclease V) alpha subunit